MTEGLRTVVANPRLTEFDLLALYEDLTIALQRVAAATRSHQAERARLHGKTTSMHEVFTAWGNATEVLDGASASIQRAHDAIMANALVVGRALRAQEVDD